MAMRGAVAAQSYRRRSNVTALTSKFQYTGPPVDDHILPHTRFTFVDFFPKIFPVLNQHLDSPGNKATPNVEEGADRASTDQPLSATFNSLLDEANRWLRIHPQWEVVDCESISIPFKESVFEKQACLELMPNLTSFPIMFNDETYFMRALRLWLSRRSEDLLAAAGKDFKTQVINYTDFRPAKIPKGDKDFETLDQLLERLNAALEEGHINGHIITVETLLCTANSEWEAVDPEETIYRLEEKNIFGLRVYYDVTEEPEADIGIEDFIPKHISGGGVWRKPKFDTVTDVFRAASEWLASNPNLIFINAHTIEIKLKSIDNIKSRTMAFSEHGDYLRIFRLVYARCRPDSAAAAAGPQSTYLAFKVFLPRSREDQFYNFKQMLQEETRNEIFRDAKILAAQTFHMIIKRMEEKEVQNAAEASFHTTRFGMRGADMAIGIRFYYDEGVHEWSRKQSSKRLKAVKGEKS